MLSKPKVSTDQIESLRVESAKLRPGLIADVAAVREEWKQHTANESDSARRERYQKAAELLARWMSEDPEYDERVGELLNQELSRDNSIRCENRGEEKKEP